MAPVSIVHDTSICRLVAPPVAPASLQYRLSFVTPVVSISCPSWLQYLLLVAPVSALSFVAPVSSICCLWLQYMVVSIACGSSTTICRLITCSSSLHQYLSFACGSSLLHQYYLLFSWLQYHVVLCVLWLQSPVVVSVVLYYGPSAISCCSWLGSSISCLLSFLVTPVSVAPGSSICRLILWCLLHYAKNQGF